MALLDDILNGGNVVTGLAIGVGTLVVVPLVGPVLRPAAKTAIKGGLVAYREATRLITDAVKEVENVVGEAQQEMAVTPSRSQTGGSTARAT